MREIAYVAGPLAAPTAEERDHNIANALRIGTELIRRGYATIIAHSMTGSLYGNHQFSERVFREMYLRLLLECDLVVTCEGWQESQGAVAEVELAGELGIPVIHDIRDVPQGEPW